MNIAFCINRKAFSGLGVTISSLLRNCSDSKKLQLWFLCAGLGEEDKKHIVTLLAAENYRGLYYFVDFDPMLHFGAFNSLHGDRTTYGRLLLPEIVNGDRVLYLDADLVVEVDVLDLETFQFNNCAVAAVRGGYFKNTLGNKFYIGKLKLSPDLEYFNAGVLLLNLKEWRAKEITKKCLDIARQYPQELPSHDQSLLNIYCSGNFAKLPPAFNCSWLAHQPKPGVADKMIIHFVGSPKPWDPFGLFIHNGYGEWKKYFTKVAALGQGNFSISEIPRLWHIRRSYARCVIKKLKIRRASLQVFSS